MLYKKFLQRKVLKKIWIFLCGNIKYCFKINYWVLNTLYAKNCITDIFSLISSIKRVFHFLICSIKKKDSILVIGSDFLYSKTLYQPNSTIHNLINRNPGIFSNFSIVSLYTIDKLALKRLPTIILCINLETNLLLLQEAKNKNIPVIGVFSVYENSQLVDFPIMVDALAFHSTFFFSTFFFRFFNLR